MKRAVMSAGRAYHPSPEFRAKVRQQIGPPARKSSRIPWLSLGLATAALVIVGLISVQFALSRAQTRQVASEIADLHVSNLASSTPVDVVSTDRHTVKPWFQGKLPFTFDLPELAGTDFTLVGGRLVFIEREPAALLLFKYRSHFISVFVLPDSAPVSRLGDSLRKQASFNLQSWQQAGLRYVMITDAEAVHAQRLANLLQTTAGR
jgi:anti-sigma factor RsiW